VYTSIRLNYYLEMTTPDARLFPVKHQLPRIFCIGNAKIEESKKEKQLLKNIRAAIQGKGYVEGGMAGEITSRSIRGSGYSVKGWKDVASALHCMQAQCKHF